MRTTAAAFAALALASSALAVNFPGTSPVRFVFGGQSGVPLDARVTVTPDPRTVVLKAATNAWALSPVTFSLTNGQALVYLVPAAYSAQVQGIPRAVGFQVGVWTVETNFVDIATNLTFYTYTAPADYGFATAAGTNVTAATNGTLVTLSADVSHLEVYQASNAASVKVAALRTEVKTNGYFLNPTLHNPWFTNLANWGWLAGAPRGSLNADGSVSASAFFINGNPVFSETEVNTAVEEATNALYIVVDAAKLDKTATAKNSTNWLGEAALSNAITANITTASNALAAQVVGSTNNLNIVAAGTNVVGSTNGTLVTISAVVGRTEVASASNAAVAITLTSSNALAARIDASSNAVKVAAGTNMLASTNASLVTLSAEVSKAEVSSASNTVMTFALASSNTLAVPKVLAGTNTSATTNGTLVTVSADVGWASLAAASNASVQITLTASNALKASIGTNAAAVAPGTNVSALTNGQVVTLSADVSKAEVYSASNAALAEATSRLAATNTVLQGQLAQKLGTNGNAPTATLSTNWAGETALSNALAQAIASKTNFAGGIVLGGGSSNALLQAVWTNSGAVQMSLLTNGQFWVRGKLRGQALESLDPTMINTVAGTLQVTGGTSNVLGSALYLTGYTNCWLYVGPDGLVYATNTAAVSPAGMLTNNYAGAVALATNLSVGGTLAVSGGSSNTLGGLLYLTGYTNCWLFVGADGTVVPTNAVSVLPPNIVTNGYPLALVLSNSLTVLGDLAASNVTAATLSVAGAMTGATLVVTGGSSNVFGWTNYFTGPVNMTSDLAANGTNNTFGGSNYFAGNVTVASNLVATGTIYGTATNASNWTGSAAMQTTLDTKLATNGSTLWLSGTNYAKSIYITNNSVIGGALKVNSLSVDSGTINLVNTYVGIIRDLGDHSMRLNAYGGWVWFDKQGDATRATLSQLGVFGVPSLTVTNAATVGSLTVNSNLTVNGTAYGTFDGDGSALTGLVTPYVPTGSLLPTRYTVRCWGDSMTAGVGGTAYPIPLASLTGRDVNNHGIGGHTALQIRTNFLARPDRLWADHIIWAGRNDVGGSTNAALTNIAAMVAAIPTNCHFAVISVCNGEIDKAYPGNYEWVTNVNTHLAAIYGTNFLDLRSYIVGLYDPNSPDDVTAHNEDRPPPSLTSDGLHFNAAGYAATAQFLSTNIHRWSMQATNISQVGVGAVLASPPPIGERNANRGIFTRLATGVGVGSFYDVSEDSYPLQVFRTQTNSPGGVAHRIVTDFSGIHQTYLEWAWGGGAWLGSAMGNSVNSDGSSDWVLLTSTNATSYNERLRVNASGITVNGGTYPPAAQTARNLNGVLTNTTLDGLTTVTKGATTNVSAAFVSPNTALNDAQQIEFYHGGANRWPLSLWGTSMRTDGGGDMYWSTATNTSSPFIERGRLTKEGEWMFGLLNGYQTTSNTVSIAGPLGVISKGGTYWGYLGFEASTWTGSGNGGAGMHYTGTSSGGGIGMPMASTRYYGGEYAAGDSGWAWKANGPLTKGGTLDASAQMVLYKSGRLSVTNSLTVGGTATASAFTNSFGASLGSDGKVWGNGASFRSTSFPVVDIVRDTVSNVGGVWGGAKLERVVDSGVTPINNSGIGFYFKTPNSARTSTYAGLFGGALAVVTNGVERGELVFSPAFLGNDPSATRHMVLTATGTNTSALTLSGSASVSSNLVVGATAYMGHYGTNAWSPGALTPGGIYIWHSNGVASYVLKSGLGTTNWSSTNLWF